MKSLILFAAILLLSEVSANIELKSKLGNIDFGHVVPSLDEMKLANELDANTKAALEAAKTYNKCFSKAVGKTSVIKNTHC